MANFQHIQMARPAVELSSCWTMRQRLYSVSSPVCGTSGWGASPQRAAGKMPRRLPTAMPLTRAAQAQPWALIWRTIQSRRRSFRETPCPSLSKASFARRETFSGVMGFLPRSAISTRSDTVLYFS